jgi:hypothetical protein
VKSPPVRQSYIDQSCDSGKPCEASPLIRIEPWLKCEEKKILRFAQNDT